MTAAPSSTAVEPPDDPLVQPMETQSDDFKSMLAHVEQTLGTPEPQQAPVEDTRPVDPPKVKKETPPAKDKASSKQVAVPESKQAAPETKEEPETFTSPSRENFKKIVGERDAAKKQAAEHEATVKAHAEKLSALEKEHTEFKAKVSIKPEEIEELRKRNETLETTLKRHALAETPKFKDHYNGRFEAAISLATKIVGKAKADQVKVWLEAPDSESRDQALEAMTVEIEGELGKRRFSNAVDAFDSARNERAKALENHEANLQAWNENQRKEAQEKQEREVSNRKAVLAETLKAAAKFDAFTESDDDPEHNLSVARNKKLVEDFIVGGNLPDEVVIMLPVLAKQGEHLQKKVPQLEAKVAELTEALNRYQGASPELSGSGDPVNEGGQEEASSYVSQVMKQWPGAVQQQR